MLHTDGNNPSQQLHLTSLTLVKKEAPEVGVGCAGPCLNEQNGVQAGGRGGGRNRGRGLEMGDGRTERRAGRGGKFFFFFTKCLSESPSVLSTL